MSSSHWRLGEVFVLRHAGFPFDWVESLGLPDPVLQRIDAWLDEEQRAYDLARTVEARLADRIRAELAKGGRPVLPKAAPAELAPMVAKLAEDRKGLEAAWREARTELRRRLHALASDNQIQEAVFLSSPDMYDNVWARYVARDPTASDNADSRRVERQVYSYLQRFCAKNETTSFFGPMGYGIVEGEGEIEVVRHPPARRRRTFLAFWVVQELAKGIGKDKALRKVLPLRRNPMFTVVGDRAECTAASLSVPLAPAQERLLDLLTRTPLGEEQLAKELGVEAADLERSLLPLLKGGVVVRALQYETQDFNAFANLRRAVTALPAGPSRDGWLEKLDRLDRLRGAFERAGFPERRERLAELEAAFTEITGQPARRGEGKMYTDRLVIYEEGGSPFQLRFGRDFAKKLEAAVSESLELSASFGERVQRGYRSTIRDRLGVGQQLDFISYASKLRPTELSGSQFSPVEPLSIPAEAGSEQTVEASLLPASTPGGRFSLPDVCIGASLGPDGQPKVEQVLVARVHHHLFLWNWLCAFFEDRPRIEQVAKRWLEGEPTAKNLASLSLSRRNKGFYVFPGPKVAYTASDALEGGAGTTYASSLTVRIDDDGPTLLDEAGRLQRLYLPLADFSTYPPFAALAHPLVLHAPLRNGTPHVPRVRLGGALYQRQRWEADLSSLASNSGLEFHLALRREAKARGWPRFVYGRVMSERKPFLVDTASPISMELLRHLVHDDARCTFEEMLPGPDQLFLRDERGRYTFELRMQIERWSEEPAGS